jgi:hypothetical protein
VDYRPSFLAWIVIGGLLATSCAGSPMDQPAAASSLERYLVWTRESAVFLPPSKAPNGQLPVPVIPLASPSTLSDHFSHTPVPAVPERRLIALEYPYKIRAGDLGIIRLAFEMDGAQSVAPVEEIEQTENAFESHTVIAEAVVDLPGMEVRPPRAVSEPLLPGQTVDFRWDVRPPISGMFRGTVWLFLVFIDKSTGEQSRTALVAQSISIEVGDFLGLDGRTTRLAGAAGSMIGVALAFPFLEDVVKRAWRKTRWAT